MSIFQLNGKNESPKRPKFLEFVREFAEEQGPKLTAEIRKDFEAALQEDMGDHFESAELKYKKLLHKVGGSKVLRQRMENIRKRKEHAG